MVTRVVERPIQRDVAGRQLPAIPQAWIDRGGSDLEYFMSNVMKIVNKVLTQNKSNPSLPLLEAFRVDCLIRNLTPKTLDVYFERLGYLLKYLLKNDISISDVNKSVIQGY